MYRLNIKKYVDVMFDGNINKFAKAIGVNYNPAKQLYSSETTRINFDVLTSLCDTFHCTPNDILINDDITNGAIHLTLFLTSTIQKKNLKNQHLLLV